MAGDSPLQRLAEVQTGPVGFRFEDRALQGCAGDTVAAALLAAGVRVLRESPVDASPRAPYCMMGACFECLVEIDGVPNQQACMVPLTEGMDVRIMRGAAEARVVDDD